LHVLACALLILAVLLQPGKSGGLGAFSGVAAQQVFGGRGAGNFLTKISWTTATTFFITSVSLAALSSSRDVSLSKRAKPVVNTAQSSSPAKSAAPAQRAKPAAPAKSNAPAEPAAPMSSESPAESAPAEPVKRAPPAQPVKRAPPAQPVKRAPPAQPNVPTQPAAPVSSE
jgi:preprotein translocase subunit SecG